MRQIKLCVLLSALIPTFTFAEITLHPKSVEKEVSRTVASDEVARLDADSDYLKNSLLTRNKGTASGTKKNDFQVTLIRKK